MGRFVWNVGGAAVLSLAALVAAYWLVELITPLMAGEAGPVGVVGLVVAVVVFMVALFLGLLRVVPWWVGVGERIFPGPAQSGPPAEPDSEGEGAPE